MTYYDAWVKAPDASGESDPVWFPPSVAGTGEPFFVIRDAIRAGRLQGEQVSHLAWHATVTRAELEAILTGIYGPPGVYEARNAGPLEHLADKMRALRAFIAAAPPGQVFELAADEF